MSNHNLITLICQKATVTVTAVNTYYTVLDSDYFYNKIRKPKNSLARQNEALSCVKLFSHLLKIRVQAESHIMYLGYGFFPCHITTVKND
jgi:hypothetical protein